MTGGQKYTIRGGVPKWKKFTKNSFKPSIMIMIEPKITQKCYVDIFTCYGHFPQSWDPFCWWQSKRFFSKDSEVLTSELNEIFLNKVYQYDIDPRASRILKQIFEYVSQDVKSEIYFFNKCFLCDKRLDVVEHLEGWTFILFINQFHLR